MADSKQRLTKAGASKGSPKRSSRKQTRRRFLKTSAAAGAGFSTFTIAGTKASGKVLGVNSEVRVAVAGLNGRGKAHIGGFRSLKGVRITYLVDPDSRLFESRSKSTGGKPKCVEDIRKVLEDKEVDAVSIATPNHWHSLMSIWACQAGKDVYVEKPLSHNVFEGRKLVEAAKKYNRVVQHGTQKRSSQGVANLISAVQADKYGKLLVSKSYCCKPHWSIGRRDTSVPPEGLDFNLWLGPASEQPYHRNLVHYNWHWFWDTGNGDIGNQGVHEMDIARWTIKGATLPKRVWSLGGRFAVDDQGQTPNTQLSVFDYGDTTLLFETRGPVGKHKKFPPKIENEFYTTEGVIRGGRFYPTSGGKPESVQADDAPKVTPGGPFGSFIAAVRSRNMDEINCDAEVGHYSSALCHLGNISYRLGKQVPFDAKRNALGDNKQVVESFNKVCENLTAAGMKLDESKYRLGRQLDFDAKAEKFVGDDEANELLSRRYRKPFVVPEKV